MLELREALQSRRVIEVSWLNRDQQVRSRRLLNFLKQALNGHSKSDHVISHYVSTVTEGNAHGYEAFRRVHQEFSLQSRAEAIGYRNSIMGFQTKESRLVDIVRAVESELHRFDTMIRGCPLDVGDLQIQEADKYLLLTRNLPEHVRLHCQLHCLGNTLDALSQAVTNYDLNTRVMGDVDVRLHGLKGNSKGSSKDKGKGKSSGNPHKGKKGDAQQKGKGKSEGKGKGGKDDSNRRSNSQGSGKGKGVVCWNCGRSGHVSKDCQQKKSDDRGATLGRAGSVDRRDMRKRIAKSSTLKLSPMKRTTSMILVP